MIYTRAAIFGIVAITAACRAAAPVVIGNSPVSINGRPVGNASRPALKPVGEMGWTDFNGGVFKLSDFRGKGVILDFWATYCPPCIEEIPHLKELRKKYGEDKLVVVGLHVGDEADRPKIPEFVRRLAIDYPLGYPDDSLTEMIFGSQSAIPQTAVFDADGRLVEKIVGFDPKIKNDLDAAVEKAVRSVK